MKRQHYIPVTIEARQSNGTWNVRNSFITENKEVEAGSLERGVLLARARARMMEWIINYSQNDSSLRISNGGR